MRKVILSIVCLFAISIVANAAILAERDCVEEAIEAGDKAEQTGASYELAYLIAENIYWDCELSQL